MRIAKLKLSFITLPLISAFILVFASCKPDFKTDQGQTWGTYYHIVYSSERPLTDSIQEQLVKIDNEFSLYNKESLVSRINSCTTDSVSNLFIELMDICIRVNKLSEGVYDPTIGPLTNLWGFGNNKDVQDAPTLAEIDSALQSVGLNDCVILSDNKLHKKTPETVFDFSSVAKGFGVDCIADMLERNGSDNYMVEIGGEVVVKGHNPKGLPWKIQVDSPASGFGHDALCVLSLGPERQSLATSGNYRNFISLGDSIYGHTVSPLTGMPVKGNVLSVTILSESCANADALATACMAAATEEYAREIVRKAGVGAIIVSCDSLGEISVFKTGTGD